MKSPSPSRVGAEEIVAAVTDRGCGQDEHGINFSQHSQFLCGVDLQYLCCWPRLTVSLDP